MAHDAFGREIDEGGLDTTAAATPPPVFVPTSIPASTRVSTPVPARSRRSTGAVMAAVIGLAVVGGIVGLIAHGAGKIHAPAIHLPNVSSSGGGPPAALDDDSMLRRGNLAPALRKLEDKLGGQVRLLRIEAERVDVQVLTKDGRTVMAQMRFDAKEPTVISSIPGVSGASTFSWDQVNASAPARLVKGATKGGSPDDFGYAVLVDAAGLRWAGYTKRGQGFLANARGREIKPIG